MLLIKWKGLYFTSQNKSSPYSLFFNSEVVVVRFRIPTLTKHHYSPLLCGIFVFTPKLTNTICINHNAIESLKRFWTCTPIFIHTLLILVKIWIKFLHFVFALNNIVNSLCIEFRLQMEKPQQNDHLHLSAYPICLNWKP